MQLTENQSEAVRLSTSAPLALVTGGPGTGKTTVIRGMVRACRAQGDRIVLLAPTGKAASRISQHVGVEARTIHRALEPQPPYGFTRKAGNPLDADVIVVDESSMIDLALFASLTRAIAPGARLVLVGDDAQLPPVGAGSPFAEFIASGKVPHVRLERSFRQTAGSAISEAAYAILAGKMPTSSAAADIGSGSAFYFVKRPDALASIATVMAMVQRNIPAALGVEVAATVQVLTPTREGPLGAGELNAALVAHYNPGARRKGQLRAGDRVIQCVNNYQLGVFNGDTGRVLRTDKYGSVTVDFNSVEVTFSPHETGDLVLAYALTCHKSQGSEYDAVIICVDDSHGRGLYRSLLYTAVTRARRLCVVVGSANAMVRAIDRVLPPRESNLRPRIDALLAPPPAAPALALADD